MYVSINKQLPSFQYCFGVISWFFFFRERVKRRFLFADVSFLPAGYGLSGPDVTFVPNFVEIR